MKLILTQFILIVTRLAGLMTGKPMMGVLLVLGGQSPSPANFWIVTAFLAAYAVFSQLYPERHSKDPDNLHKKLSAAVEPIIVATIVAVLAIFPFASSNDPPELEPGTPHELGSDGEVKFLPVIRPSKPKHKTEPAHQWQTANMRVRKREAGFRTISSSHAAWSRPVEEPSGTGIEMTVDSLNVSNELMKVDGAKLYQQNDNSFITHKQELHPSPCGHCSGDLDTTFTITRPAPTRPQ